MNVLLICGHYAVVADNHSRTTAYCIPCFSQGPQDIVQAQHEEWHVYCTTKTCRYSRWTGQSKETANSRSRSHRAYNPTHRTVIEYRDRLVEPARGHGRLLMHDDPYEPYIF